jgi:hypothetical protein
MHHLPGMLCVLGSIIFGYCHLGRRLLFFHARTQEAETNIAVG